MMNQSSTKTLLCLLLLSSFFKGVIGQQCTPCEGDVDPNLSFDGVPCDYWVSVAGHNPAGSAQCAFDRMVGVWFCGCPLPDGVEDTCTLCRDGSPDFNKAKTFPDSQITCDAISEVPAIDGAQTCRELMQMSGYCECPLPEAESDAKCTMCPNGATPATPERVLLTTGESCQQIIDTIDMSPANDCNKFLPNLMIDYRSYCGCPDSEPPTQCNLCPAGTHLADPDHEIMYVPGSTCADFDNYTKYISDPQLCDYMHEVISMECCEGMDPALTNYTGEEDGCDFCPGGREVLKPERPLVGTDVTCGELASRGNGHGACGDRFKTEFDSLMDTSVYCVCPGSQKTSDCSFCPPGEVLLYPDNPITDGVAPSNATCAEYAAMADSTSDASFCRAVQSIGGINSCCGVPPDAAGGAPGGAPEQGGGMPQEGMCSLCGAGEVQNGERIFLGTSVSCQLYQNEMSNVPEGDMCDSIFADFASTFDPKVYCGCPDTKPTEMCNLCPEEGSEVVDPNIWISDVFTTCGQMDDIAQATTDQEFCSSIQRVGQYYCCYSPGSAGPGAGPGGRARHLRSSLNDEQDEQEQAATANNSGAASLSPYHFSAIKAMDSIQKKVANLVNEQHKAMQINSEEHH